MTWRESGREKSWWVDSAGKMVVWWRPILSEFEDEEPVDPLDLLTERQRFVIELRYGLNDGLEYSQRDVAQLMGVSRSMVHQHERAAIKKLEKYLRRGSAPQPNVGKEPG